MSYVFLERKNLSQPCTRVVVWRRAPIHMLSAMKPDICQHRIPNDMPHSQKHGSANKDARPNPMTGSNASTSATCNRSQKHALWPRLHLLDELTLARPPGGSPIAHSIETSSTRIQKTAGSSRHLLILGVSGQVPCSSFSSSAISLRWA